MSKGVSRGAVMSKYWFAGTCPDVNKFNQVYMASSIKQSRVLLVQSVSSALDIRQIYSGRFSSPCIISHHFNQAMSKRVYENHLVCHGTSGSSGFQTQSSCGRNANLIQLLNQMRNALLWTLGFRENCGSPPFAHITSYKQSPRLIISCLTIRLRMQGHISSVTRKAA